jgi:aldehyde dehydrogenase (NAD+)
MTEMTVAKYFDEMSYGPAPEADTEARAWLARHKSEFGHFINGAFAPSASGKSFETYEPATGAVLARIAAGESADVDRAVAAARKAQGAWAKLPGHARARHLYALARMIQRHGRLIAVVEALDNGKPIRETRDIDVPLAARHFYHHAGWAQLQETEFADQVPVGVVGQIIPWNFPFLMLAWKIAPALALGNTVVLKPAEFTSLTALLFAELAAAAGLPAGVLNVVTGEGETGALIVDHADIDKIAFTGSTEVGRIIRERTAGSGKSLTLELGGKSPFIVFDDADIDGAVEGVVDAIWFNQGQVCCAGSRLLVQEGIADLFHQRLKRRMQTLRVGQPLDKCIDMGAIVAPVQLDRIERLVRKGVSEGATLHQAKIELPMGGSFFPPTLLSGVQPTSIVATEEIFGPVAVSMTFRTPEEAVQLANHSRYGLSASIWSETIGLALNVAAQLAAGVVWVNATNLFDAAVGFGGKRESGFGREGGREGCYEYLKPKAWIGRKPRVTASLPQLKPVAGDFALPALDRTAKLFIGGKQAGRQLFPRRRLGKGQGSGRSRRGQPQGYPQRRRGRAQRLGLGKRHDPQSRADPLLHCREFERPRRRVRRPHRRHDRHVRRRRAGGGRCFDLATFHLRRMGRQIRRRGAPAAAAGRGAGHAGAAGRGRRDLSAGSAAARVHKPRRAADRHRKPRRSGSQRAAPAGRHGLLLDPRNVGRSGRRRQHRHRLGRRIGQDARCA